MGLSGGAVILTAVRYCDGCDRCCTAPLPPVFAWSKRVGFGAGEMVSALYEAQRALMRAVCCVEDKKEQEDEETNSAVRKLPANTAGDESDKGAEEERCEKEAHRAGSNMKRHTMKRGDGVCREGEDRPRTERHRRISPDSNHTDKHTNHHHDERRGAAVRVSDAVINDLLRSLDLATMQRLTGECLLILTLFLTWMPRHAAASSSSSSRSPCQPHTPVGHSDTSTGPPCTDGTGETQEETSAATPRTGSTDMNAHTPDTTTAAVQHPHPSPLPPPSLIHAAHANHVPPRVLPPHAATAPPTPAAHDTRRMSTTTSLRTFRCADSHTVRTAASPGETRAGCVSVCAPRHHGESDAAHVRRISSTDTMPNSVLLCEGETQSAPPVVVDDDEEAGSPLVMCEAQWSSRTAALVHALLHHVWTYPTAGRAIHEGKAEGSVGEVWTREARAMRVESIGSVSCDGWSRPAGCAAARRAMRELCGQAIRLFYEVLTYAEVREETAEKEVKETETDADTVSVSAGEERHLGRHVDMRENTTTTVMGDVWVTRLLNYTRLTADALDDTRACLALLPPAPTPRTSVNASLTRPQDGSAVTANEEEEDEVNLVPSHHRLLPHRVARRREMYGASHAGETEAKDNEEDEDDEASSNSFAEVRRAHTTTTPSAPLARSERGDGPLLPPIRAGENSTQGEHKHKRTDKKEEEDEESTAHGLPHNTLDDKNNEDNRLHMVKLNMADWGTCDTHESTSPVSMPFAPVSPPSMASRRALRGCWHRCTPHWPTRGCPSATSKSMRWWTSLSVGTKPVPPLCPLRSRARSPGRARTKAATTTMSVEARWSAVLVATRAVVDAAVSVFEPAMRQANSIFPAPVLILIRL